MRFSTVLLGLMGLASAQSTTTSTSASATSTACVLPGSVPSTALTVGPAGSCATYNTLQAAVSALPADSSTQYIYILTGTYNGQVSIGRTGATIIRGQSASTSFGAVANGVNIDFSDGVLSSSGSSEGSAVFRSTAYSGSTLSFYNIDFTNTFAAATGTIAIAMDIKAIQAGFYSCNFKSSQGTLLVNYGSFYFENCVVEGTSDFVWGYGGTYFYNSRIISDSTTAGSAITAQIYQSSYGNSEIVFDHCSFVPISSAVPQGSYYLGRDYNTNSRVAVTNSFLDAHIATAGWLISVTPTNVSFSEFNNTGPGASCTRAAGVKFLSSTVGYAAADVLGSTSWIDITNVVPFTGFSKSVYSLSGNVSSICPASPTSTSSTSSSTSTTMVTVTSSSMSITSSSTSAKTNTTATSTTSSAASSTSSCATSTSTFVVSKNPSACQYGNITAAINALPADGLAKVILIGAGVYAEQLSITRNGKVSLIGATTFPNDFTQNTVTVEISNGQLTSAGLDETTPTIHVLKSDTTGVAIYNINFINLYPQTANTAALASDFYGASIGVYGCKFVGFQDTFLANKGIQVVSNSYIEGSIDYIWGFSTAFFHQCWIAHNTAGGCISAQSRSTATSVGGYVFDTCLITYTSTYGNVFNNSFLGRPYSNFSIAVYQNSFIDQDISSMGWHVWQTTNPQTSNVFFGEYNNTGPGSWGPNTQRVSFATNMTAAQAVNYTLPNWIGSTSWIDFVAYNYTPSYSLTSSPWGPTGNESYSSMTSASTVVPSSTSSSASVSNSVTSTTMTTVTSTSMTTTSAPTSTSSTTSTTASTTTTSTSSTTVSVPVTTYTSNPINAHPLSGTVPPVGAVIVIANSSIPNSYTNLTSALASLPADTTNQTIFIYPGSYTEQIPSINRPGPVRIIGYTTGNPGQRYQDNTVNITFSSGLSVSPLPSGASDSQTATVYTASNNIAMYNLNFINTNNLNGSTSNYVTLAAAIYSDDTGFYACSFVGWQDTLLTGTRTGYQYYESSYIEGAIDFIWGYSKAYFKGCTIAGKHSGSCFTAQSRLNAAAVGGYVFDQCLITQAADITANLSSTMFLGRPYDSYATVVYKYSYLDSVISPVGWKVWSATSPNTDFITFAEYQNGGPRNWESNVAARLSFGNATLLTFDNYTLPQVMDSLSWIDFTYWTSIVTPTPGSVMVS